MEEFTGNRPLYLDPEQVKAPSFTKPVWQNEQMTCDQCQYDGQDIDTFPCAKCHARA